VAVGPEAFHRYARTIQPEGIPYGLNLAAAPIAEDDDRFAEKIYPALHHLTSPMRKAAAASGNPERINLWAGTGHRYATAEPAAHILTRLAGRA
jgi:NAD(P)H-dependent flavin oxidoreductase YrpB (nitropropane dioxygenase family)